MKQKDSEFHQDNNIPKINDETFISVMQQEREIEMDLSFEDFIKKVEEEQPIVNRPFKSYNLTWITTLAACLLIVFGCVYFFKNENIKDNTIPKNIEIVKHDIKIKEVQSDEINIKEEQKLKESVKYLTDLFKTTSKNPVQKSKSSINLEDSHTEDKSSIETENSYDELVVVNGEVVEDEQKAQQIALDALKLLAINMDKGTKAVEQLKKIAVEY